MLKLTNCYLNGYVAVPVIAACNDGGLFRALEKDKRISISNLRSKLGANEGHLRVALRMFQSLKWITLTTNDAVRLEPAFSAHRSVPANLTRLYKLKMEEYLAGEGGKLEAYIAAMRARRENGESWLTRFLDGPLVVPILIALKQGDLITRFSRLKKGVRSELTELLALMGWAEPSGKTLALSETGEYFVSHALVMGVTASYRPMLAEMNELLFGNPKKIFECDAKGHERHIDRTLNVVGSGFQHGRYFSALDEIIESIFNRPLPAQPNYIADMGCGDGTLLKRVYEVVRERTERGRQLSDHPLQLVGVDFNAAALAETTRTLGDIPHLTFRGDVGAPGQLAADLQTHGVAPEEVLHLRSFLDHEHAYRGDQAADPSAVEDEIEGVFVDHNGSAISSGRLHRSLVDHLTGWADIMNRHGLAILEVHSLPAATVSQHLDESESFHFDALQAFSSQHLVGADAFLLAAAEAGLFSDPKQSSRYPENQAFTRITLGCFEKRPFTLRHPQLTDHDELLDLEAKCWPDELRVSPAEIQRRITDCARGSLVLEMKGRIVGAMYTQRILDASQLTGLSIDEVPGVCDPAGNVVQLLSINVHPDMKHHGLGDHLLQFMLQWLRLKPDVKRIVGISRCSAFAQHRDTTLKADYIRQRDDDGRLLDPILRFHENHGATIGEVAPGFRPADEENFGCGVFLEYELRAPDTHEVKVPADLPSTAEAEEPESEIDLAAMVEAAVRNILGSSREEAYGSTASFEEMGLDSVDMMDLNERLAQDFGMQLENSFLLHFKTPKAVTSYIEGMHSVGATSVVADPEPASPSDTTPESIDFNDAAADIPQIHAVVTEQKRRAVKVDDRWVFDFASCNYLGLDLHDGVVDAILPAIKEWGVHPSWTRAVASPAIYEELEQELADLVRAPSVLVFPAVTLLHAGVLPVLAGPDGVILKDQFAHHSIIEGCHLAVSGGAKLIDFKHNDPADLERRLAELPMEQTKVIAVDGVYSMSGAYPPLPEFSALAKKYNAWVYMDDAHGVGVIGENPTTEMPYGQKGNGVVNHYGLDYAKDRLIYVAGLSKSFSSFGAFITCVDDEMKDKFRSASTFIFSGPSPTASLASAIAGLKLNRDEGEAWRRQIYRLTHRLVTGAREMDYEVVNENYFPIVGIVIGSTANTIEACQILWEYGILITPALFPIVPKDRGLLRFSITAANTEEEIEQSLDALRAVRRKLLPGT